MQQVTTQIRGEQVKYRQFNNYSRPEHLADSVGHHLVNRVDVESNDYRKKQAKKMH